MGKNLFSSIGRSLSVAGLKIKKHSPEILLIGGIAGGIAGTVMACKATLKVEKVLDDTKEKLELIHEATEKGITRAGEEYTAEDCKKETTIVYIQAGVKLAKLYGPAIILGGLSIASLLASHNISKQRNLALAAAYAAVDSGFKNYRKNVVEKFGKEIDTELRYGIKASEIDVEKTDEKGTTEITKEKVDVVEGMPCDFSRFFDETSTQWTKDPEYNLLFLRKQQDWANEVLRSRGYLFINDVYESLGMQKSKYGHVAGWVYNEKNPVGDNYVDFGIYNGSKQARMFVNGLERSILLDFNIDGNVLELVDTL